MITLDEALSDCQNASSDTTASTQSLFVTWLNQGYQNLMAMFNRPGIEKIMNTTTQIVGSGVTLTDSMRSYQMPPDFLFAKTIKLQIGARWYNLIEEESTEMWNYRTEYAYGGIPSMFYVNENYGVASAEIQIDPIATATSTTGSLFTPTSATITSNTLTLTFASAPGFTQGQYVTLAGFVLASGVNINNVWAVSGVSGSQVTISLPSDATDTVTTIGTAAATSGVPMQIVYESSDIRLDHVGISPNPAYSFMTTSPAHLTFTNGSNIVTSNANVFQSYMQLGSSYVSPLDDGDGNWYRIINYNSPTSVTIGNVYQGFTTTSSTNWSVNHIMSLHVDLQDIPEYWALWKYYIYKKDADWRDYYETEYYKRLNMAKANWATKSRSAIIRSKNGLSRWHSYPGWFPALGVSS